MSEGEPDIAAELRALREEIGSLREELGRRSDETKSPEQDAPAPSFSWLSSLEPRAPRRLTVPRLLLEAAFIVAVATVAALAELEPLVIVGVMAGAWALVALAEWAASRADRRREELLYAPPPLAPEPVADPAWFTPPVEQTRLEVPAAAEPETEVTKLPPRVESEQTEERSVH